MNVCMTPDSVDICKKKKKKKKKKTEKENERKEEWTCKKVYHYIQAEKFKGQRESNLTIPPARKRHEYGNSRCEFQPGSLDYHTVSVRRGLVPKRPAGSDAFMQMSAIGTCRG